MIKHAKKFKTLCVVISALLVSSCTLMGKKQVHTGKREVASYRQDGKHDVELYVKEAFQFYYIQDNKPREYWFIGEVCLKNIPSNVDYVNTSVRVFLNKPRINAAGFVTEEISKEGRSFTIDMAGCVSMSLPLDHRLFKPPEKCSIPIDIWLVSVAEESSIDVQTQHQFSLGNFFNCGN